jgi:16S rRNA (adenine1518-N6/adenine1519-N6)-dimethyltransferase
MVQKEVAEKFTAKVNDKDYSSLGIITELISVDSRILFDVPPESFDPPPKIISSILYIKKDMNKCLDRDFNKFLKACFVQPRKKLSKNLTSVIDKNTISKIYEELEINDNVRPHEVSSSLYSQMHTRVKDGRN